MTTFADLGVRERTLASLAKLDITMPKAIQVEGIPPLMAANDAVIEAPTGSGKTLAFVLPLIERLAGHGRNGPRALIVGPTRELVAQIVAVIRSVDPGLRTALLVGGVGYGRQTGELNNSPDVVVGCPGRILDLAGQGILRFSTVEFLVLDEADEMLDQGFARDVERIIGMLPTHYSMVKRQTVLASATMPDWVQRMVDKHLVAPVHIRAVHDHIPDLEHGILALNRDEKIDALNTLLTRQAATDLPKTIIFHRTKHGAKKLTRDLLHLGHHVGELQGNLSQNARDRAIGDFRKGATRVLVATNVAARGIDVDGVGLVINYELPDTAQWLTHRIGRTARNGNSGLAITMLTPDDDDQWRKLRRLGAPALPHLDGVALLRDAIWSYTETPPERSGIRAPIQRANAVRAARSGDNHRYHRTPSTGAPRSGNSAPRGTSPPRPGSGGQRRHGRGRPATSPSTPA